MRELNFDLGITAEQIANYLQQFPVLSIVGFQRSGKSTLAEILDEDLRKLDYHVFMQNATTWLHGRDRPSLGLSQAKARVDPEIVYAMTRLEENCGKGCWIVDDSEVMLAYATEAILRNLGERLRNHHFSMVLIRNRFILEEVGWFHKRQALISPKMLKLTMHPLEEKYAVEAATSMFQGQSRFQQGKWLASMSGGIPGLMSDLYRYTPEWPSEKTTPQLMRFALEKRRELDLEKPIRRMFITALERRVLPPPALLSERAKTELGVLTLAGMVSPHYAFENRPFYGDFWKLVSGQKTTPEAIPARFLETGLNLEIMIRKAGLVDLFSQEFEIVPDVDGVLAQSFAASLYCQEKFPILVRPLKVFFSENLGKFGLAYILRKQRGPLKITASSTELVDELFQQAKSL